MGVLDSSRTELQINMYEDIIQTKCYNEKRWINIQIYNLWQVHDKRIKFPVNEIWIIIILCLKLCESISLNNKLRQD